MQVVKAIEQNINLNRTQIPSSVSVSATQLLFAADLPPEHATLRNSFDVIFAGDWCTLPKPPLDSWLALTAPCVSVPSMWRFTTSS